MDFSKEYAEKLTTAEELAGRVEEGWVCCTDVAAAVPQGVMAALQRRLEKRSLRGVTLHGLLDLGPMPYGEPEQLLGVSWFSGKGAAEKVRGGSVDVMPCCYRDMPALIRGLERLDVFFTTVSPMDSHGYFSTGVSASNSVALFQRAKRVYLEVNPNMPRGLSSPMIHISQVTALCENDAPLPVMKPAVLDEVSRTIGGYIAQEIPDGATLQLGIGAIPEAVGFALRDKRELGIHTELLTDSMVELIECGAVTNSRKPIHTGKTVATMAFGSERIYRFVHENPAVEILPVDYVNNPAVIARHPNFISVNGALEVDFFGQVCAESIGTKHISGTGGQVDYVRGAVESEGGKSFIAFPSTAQNGTVSRIRPILTPGAVVTTSKNDVDCIVTEYGVARLRGRTLSQRTKALIAIAHPKFREELTRQAKERNIMI